MKKFSLKKSLLSLMVCAVTAVTSFSLPVNAVSSQNISAADSVSAANEVTEVDTEPQENVGDDLISISNAKLTLSKTTFDYVGHRVIPSIKVTLDGKELRIINDYYFTFSNNENVGTARVTVHGRGSYTGAVRAYYTIVPIDLSSIFLSATAPSVVYTGSPVTSKPVIRVDGPAISEDNYTLSYSNNIYVGKGKVTITGKNNLTGSKTIDFDINPPGTPASVDGFTAKSSTHNSISLGWNSNNLCDGYEIYRATSEYGTYTLAKVLTSTSSNSATITDLLPATKYFLKIRGYKTINGVKYFSPYSALQTIKTQNLKLISGLKTTASTNSSVTVAWDKSSECTGYELYKSTSENGTYTLAVRANYNTTTSYKVISLDPSTTYYFKIRGVYKTKSTVRFSSFSSPVSRATMGVAAISGLKTTGSTLSSVSLSWNKSDPCTGYELYQSTSQSGNYTLAVKANYNTTTSYKVVGLMPSTTYYYKIRGFITTGGSTTYTDYSAVVSKATTALKSVSGLASAGATTNSVTLKWTANSDCSGYEIYKSTSSSSGFELAGTVAGKTSASFTAKNLKASAKYYFKVRSYYEYNGQKAYSGYSSAINKTTSAAASTGTTPVEKHGKLSVKGANIVDKNGNIFRLQGMSTHGIMWEDYSDILETASLKVLRDDWKCNAIRIAMYTSEWGGYTTGSDYASQAKQKVIKGVTDATSLGMYAIIDWHILSDGDPRTHQSEAVSFFKEMANKYKNQDNVIYEICNEPNGGISWTGGIKSYCEAVVKAIRAYDSDAIIVCGTGTWSQDIDQVLGNKLSDKNCVYALHFYANTHTDWLRNRLQSCYDKGLPVLVTEFGTCDASGNSGFNESQTKSWYNLMTKLGVGCFNWSACGKGETASAFNGGTNLKAIKSGESQLTQSGKLIRSLYRSNTTNT